MGLVIVLVVVATLVLVAAPATAIGIAVVARAQRERTFRRTCVLTALVSVLAQYAYVLAPFSFLQTREISWGFVLAPFLGWHLAAPPVLAAILWLGARLRRTPAPSAVLSGLLFSVAAAIVLALPVLVSLGWLFDLRFAP